jgi:predicted acetyltransferase
MKLICLKTDKNTLRYALKEESKIVGKGGIRLKTTRAGDIVYKIYEPERRKGYGTALLKLLIKEAKKIGKQELILICRKSNIPSKKIIERNGGKFIEEIKIDKKENRLKYLIKT